MKNTNQVVEITERIEGLLAEKASAMAIFREDIAGLYLEAKGKGIDVKALRRAIADRARQRKFEEADSGYKDTVRQYLSLIAEETGL